MKDHKDLLLGLSAFLPTAKTTTPHKAEITSLPKANRTTPPEASRTIPSEAEKPTTSDELNFMNKLKVYRMMVPF